MTGDDAAAIGHALAGAALLARLDEDGVVQAASPAWRALVGRELVGAPLASIVRDPDSTILAAALASARSGPPRRCEVALTSGHALSLVLARDGSGIAVMAVDVSATRRALDSAADRDAMHRALHDALLVAHRDARQAADDARRLAEARSHFLTLAGHELRTPLAGLIGLLELAGDAHARRESDLRDAASAARHVLALVDDLLDLAGLEAGRVPLRDDAVDVAAVIDEALTTVDATARDKGLAMAAAVAPGVGRRRGDALRLRQVLVNLLGNAVRHTERGSVTVRATAGAGDELRLEVEDTGPGVDPDEAERLFAPFAQGEGPRGEAGLGLSISRQLVESMGGRLWVEPAPDGGSVFVARVRLARAEAETEAESDTGTETESESESDTESESESESESDTESESESESDTGADPGWATIPVDVLVLDDQPLGRDILVRQLAHLGHRAIPADSITAALALAADHHLDLVLVDLHLGADSGLDAAQRLRVDAHRRGARWLPIVALSADRTGEAAVAAAGLDGWLLRPVDTADLATLAARVVAGALAAPVDPDELADRFGHRPTLVRDVSRLFVERYPEITAPLREALATGEREVVARAAHAARGAVGMVCASRAVALCERIEIGTDDLVACAGLIDEVERELRRTAAALAATL